jgi:ribosome-binding factor A
MTQRTQRVAKTIKEELGRMVEVGEIRDPRIGFVTFTGVEVTPDLRQAVVYYSSLGDRKAQTETGAGLTSAKGFIRSELGKRLNLKHTPDLEFKFDESVETGMRIAKLIHKIHERERPTEE